MNKQKPRWNDQNTQFAFLCWIETKVRGSKYSICTTMVSKTKSQRERIKILSLHSYVEFTYKKD